MANPNPGGSLWRKWDLHVHAPGTKMNDGYATKDGKTDLEQFCKIIHDSDVAVAAITDYFSLDSYFAVKEKYEEMFPNDGKLLLPNLEVRLDLSVNRDGQNVNLHLIFRPTLTQQEADKFLGRLDTGGTTGSTRARTTCKDLSTSQQLESATVSMASIESAIMGTFGEHAAHRSERLQHVLVVASAKGDGIRPGGTNGIQRKRLLTDEVDKFCDAFYGNPGSRDYFIDVNRLEGDEKTSPKPVFDGCDAHSFDDLCAGLGKHITQGGPRRNTTWIKADPTYVGLLQTLIEPDERVAMQAAEPDQKADRIVGLLSEIGRRSARRPDREDQRAADRVSILRHHTPAQRISAVGKRGGKLDRNSAVLQGEAAERLRPAIRPDEPQRQGRDGLAEDQLDLLRGGGEHTAIGRRRAVQRGMAPAKTRRSGAGQQDQNEQQATVNSGGHGASS